MPHDPNLIRHGGSFYAPIGDFIRERYLDLPFAQGTRQEVDFLIAELGLRRGQRVLDVGCGPGRHALELARRGLAVTGVDISEGFLEVARATAEREGLPAEFRALDARHLDYGAHFDAAISLCEGAFGLVGTDDDHLAVLDGMARTLRPGGKLALSFISALNAFRHVEPAQPYDLYTNTTCEDVELLSPTGQAQRQRICTTAFTYRELKFMLQAVGLGLLAGYGCTVGRFTARPIEIDDVEILVIAGKP